MTRYWSSSRPRIVLDAGESAYATPLERLLGGRAPGYRQVYCGAPTRKTREARELGTRVKPNYKGSEGETIAVIAAEFCQQFHSSDHCEAIVVAISQQSQVKEDPPYEELSRSENPSRERATYRLQRQRGGQMETEAAGSSQLRVVRAD